MCMKYMKICIYYTITNVLEKHCELCLKKCENTFEDKVSFVNKYVEFFQGRVSKTYKQ